MYFQCLGFLPSSSSSSSSNSGLLFCQKILYLENLNINSHAALQLNPDFHSSPLSSLHFVEQCLFSFGLTRSSLGRILDMYPQLTTLPHLWFPSQWGLNPISSHSKVHNSMPQNLVSSVPNQLRPTFSFLQNLGGSSFNHFSHRSAIGFKCGRYPFAKDSVFAKFGVFLWAKVGKQP